MLSGWGGDMPLEGNVGKGLGHNWSVRNDVHWGWVSECMDSVVSGVVPGGRRGFKRDGVLAKFRGGCQVRAFMYDCWLVAGDWDTRWVQLPSNADIRLFGILLYHGSQQTKWTAVLHRASHKGLVF